MTAIDCAPVYSLSLPAGNRPPRFGGLLAGVFRRATGKVRGEKSGGVGADGVWRWSDRRQPWVLNTLELSTAFMDLARLRFYNDVRTQTNNLESHPARSLNFHHAAKPLLPEGFYLPLPRQKVTSVVSHAKTNLGNSFQEKSELREDKNGSPLILTKDGQTNQR